MTIEPSANTPSYINKHLDLPLILKKCESDNERERYIAYSKIADLFSLDEENDLPPIDFFADIIKNLIMGMSDES
jgi:hypothetical protein